MPRDTPLTESATKSDDIDTSASWESQGRIRLMDSGMSNNLPNHVLVRKERSADIIIAFDASSDVQAGSAMRRIHNFADDCQITLVDSTHLFDPPYPLPSLDNEGKGIESAF